MSILSWIGLSTLLLLSLAVGGIILALAGIGWLFASGLRADRPKRGRYW
jgi:hypothetical protein